MRILFFDTDLFKGYFFKESRDQPQAHR